MSSIITKGINGIYSFINPQETTFIKTPEVNVNKKPIKTSLSKVKPIVIDEEQSLEESKKVEEPEVKKFKPIVYNDEEDDTLYRMILMLLGKPLYEINNKGFYVLPINKLKNMNIVPYRHQRVFNSEHVDTLKKGIIKTGYLYHPIILVNIEDRCEISIIDGQHRFKALKALLADGVSENIMVQFEVITSRDDDASIMEIYRNVNTCEPIDMKKIISDQDYVNFIQKIKHRFGRKVIVEKDKQYRHYLIESKLKDELMRYDLLLKYPSDVLMNKIISMNDELKEMALLLNKITPIEKQRCEKYDFWLGTDFPNWVKRL